MTNTTNKTELKNLLTENRKALQFAHDFAGFDLCAPFTLKETPDAPTINRIKNLLNLETVDDMNILIFIKPSSDFYFQSLHVATVEDDKINPITMNNTKTNNFYNYDIDDFCRLSDYAKMKKTAQKFYILAQDEKHQTTPTTTTEQLTTYTRYKIISNYYKKVYISPIDKNKIKPHCFCYTLNAVEIIDKSGYYTNLAKEKREQRARQLRQEKKQNEYKTLNKTEHINTIKGIINNINAMTFKATWRDLTLIDEALTTLKKARAFLENIKNNKYTNITRFQEDYNKIIQAFEDIQETRNSGKKWYVCTVYRWERNDPRKAEESTKKEFTETLQKYTNCHAHKYEITTHESKNKQNKLLLLIQK